MDTQPSPPGSFLAAGALIGTGVGTLVLLAPSLPARLAESPFSEGLASFDLALDALSVLFGLAMLVCAAGLITRGASSVTPALARTRGRRASAAAPPGAPGRGVAAAVKPTAAVSPTPAGTPDAADPATPDPLADPGRGAPDDGGAAQAAFRRSLASVSGADR